jgi:hypothetical protein
MHLTLPGVTVHLLTPGAYDYYRRGSVEALAGPALAGSAHGLSLRTESLEIIIPTASKMVVKTNSQIYPSLRGQRFTIRRTFPPWGRG